MSELKAETIVPQGSAITLQMYPKGEADAALAAKDKEIAELESNERRLKRALWLMASAVHKAKRKHYEDLLHRMTMWEGTPAGLRMHKAIDKFSGYERKCRAKAEEYK